MAKDYAKAFYNSTAWRKTQAAFMSSKHYICEDCGGVAGIVHHIRHITPENIHDPEVTLARDNLKALCIECHNIEHMGEPARLNGVAFDEAGNIIHKPNAFLVCGRLDGIRDYIAANRRAGDIVVDLAALCAALSGGAQESQAVMATAQEAHAHLLHAVAARRGGWHRAFIACTTDSEAERQALASELNAEVVAVSDGGDY